MSASEFEREAFELGKAEARLRTLLANFAGKEAAPVAVDDVRRVMEALGEARKRVGSYADHAADAEERAGRLADKLVELERARDSALLDLRAARLTWSAELRGYSVFLDAAGDEATAAQMRERAAAVAPSEDKRRD